MTGIIDADTISPNPRACGNISTAKCTIAGPVMVSAPGRHALSRLQRPVADRRQHFPESVGQRRLSHHHPHASKREAGRTDIALGCREITDVGARFADMDHAGVQTQVIYPTSVSYRSDRRYPAPSRPRAALIINSLARFTPNQQPAALGHGAAVKIRRRIYQADA